LFRQTTGRHVAGDPPAQRRQGRGERQDLLVLVLVADRAPVGMVAGQLAAAGVAAGRDLTDSTGAVSRRVGARC
jgi:hypothetical protein